MKNLYKFILASTLLIGFASSNSFAACPAVTPNSPPYPAITKIEFENPKAVSKPWVGFTNSNIDTAQVTGGSLTNGKLIFLITLDREIEAGCNLRFEIFDDSFTNMRDNRYQTNPYVFKQIAGKVIPYFESSNGNTDFTDITKAVSNGTNKLRVPVTITPVRKDTPETYTLKLSLDSNLINHPTMPAVRFRFQNNPLKITGFRQIRIIENRADDTRIGEFVTTLSEPVNPDIFLYKNKTGISTGFKTGVFLKYVETPDNPGVFLAGANGAYNTTNVMPFLFKKFDTNYSDKADHIMYKTSLFTGPRLSVQLVSDIETKTPIGPEKALVFGVQ